MELHHIYKITALRHASAVWMRLVFSRYRKVFFSSVVVGYIAVAGIGCELSGADFAEQIVRSVTNQASGTIQGAASQALPQQQQQVQELAERGEQLIASGVPDPSQVLDGAAELTQGVPERLERGGELFVSRAPDPSQVLVGAAGLTRGVPGQPERGERPLVSRVPERLERGEPLLVSGAPDPSQVLGGAVESTQGVSKQPEREEQPLVSRAPEQPERAEQPLVPSASKSPSDASAPVQPVPQKVDEADVSQLERDKMEEERINRWKEEQARIVVIKSVQEAETKQKVSETQTPVVEVEDEEKKKMEE